MGRGEKIYHHDAGKGTARRASAVGPAVERLNWALMQQKITKEEYDARLPAATRRDKRRAKKGTTK
jgi:hypothetical protein